MSIFCAGKSAICKTNHMIRRSVVCGQIVCLAVASAAVAFSAMVCRAAPCEPSLPVTTTADAVSLDSHGAYAGMVAEGHVQSLGDASCGTTTCRRAEIRQPRSAAILLHHLDE